MNIQWYPGHMTKAKRQMQEDIRIVDLLIEIVDARAPLSTRNPDIAVIGQGKARIMILNKADLADERITAAWVRYFRDLGMDCMSLDSRSRAGLKRLSALIEHAAAEKRERDRRRGIQNRPVRAMAAGIPNVGKSTLINMIAGRGAAKTGNKPGVTKGDQWIRLNRSVELLDTPGILWPRFEDPEVGKKIAFIGSVSDLVVNETELAAELLSHLEREGFGELVEARYGVREGTPGELLSAIAVKRGCLKSGGEADLKKASELLLNEYRTGVLGRISLERPEGGKEQEDA